MRILLLILLLIIVVMLMSKKDYYTSLGNVYSTKEGGNRLEPNIDCLQHPGIRFCMLTDGTPGVCGLSGMCMADMMVDLRRERDDVGRPLCTKPVFKEGCEQFCKCKGLAGYGSGDCVGECKNWFYPG